MSIKTVSNCYTVPIFDNLKTLILISLQVA